MPWLQPLQQRLLVLEIVQASGMCWTHLLQAYPMALLGQHCSTRCKHIPSLHATIKTWHDCRTVCQHHCVLGCCKDTLVARNHTPAKIEASCLLQAYPAEALALPSCCF